MIITAFYIYLAVMIVMAIAVFVTLHFVEAGYGMLLNPKWGKTISNKIAWFCMELPIFVSMLILWACSDKRFEIVPLIFLILFQIHYFERVFIFPFLLKGKSQMPVSVVIMGVSFNILNAMMQGYWIFYEAYRINPDAYQPSWLSSPQFIAGLSLFIAGFIINLHSDHIIRNLRKDENDTKHYLPAGGVFNYVTSANYFGEIIEWLGFAILTWSISGFVFFLWTCANLIPRAAAIHKRYKKEFTDEMQGKKLKRVFPFIY
jgi:3-oxo-5-alpha-steroid 4-dehydrogenase 1